MLGVSTLAHMQVEGSARGWFYPKGAVSTHWADIHTSSFRLMDLPRRSPDVFFLQKLPNVHVLGGLDSKSLGIGNVEIRPWKKKN